MTLGVQASIADIEQAFWDVVEAGEEPVEVMYGADLDTSVMGSAFPVRVSHGLVPLSGRIKGYGDFFDHGIRMGTIITLILNCPTLYLHRLFIKSP